jgi:hypothetical protein
VLLLLLLLLLLVLCRLHLNRLSLCLARLQAALGGTLARRSGSSSFLGMRLMLALLLLLLHDGIVAAGVRQAAEEGAVGQGSLQASAAGGFVFALHGRR